MLAIRMTRVGSKKKPYFRVVVTEARSARESDFVENLGTYHPRSKPAKVEINKERVQHWLKMGARPSDSVRTLLSKHLTRDLAIPVVTQPAVQAATSTPLASAREDESTRSPQAGPTASPEPGEASSPQAEFLASKSASFTVWPNTRGSG